MRILFLFCFCYPAEYSGNDLQNSMNLICFNIDEKYFKLHCYLYFQNIIREGVFLSLTNETERNLLYENVSKNSVEIFMTGDNYQKIVMFFANKILYKIAKTGLVTKETKNSDDLENLIIDSEKVQSVKNLGLSKVVAPKNIAHLEYIQFVESLKTNYIRNTYFENDIFKKFLELEFSVNAKYCTVYWFFFNINAYCETNIVQQLLDESKSRNLSINFEHSCFFTDTEKLLKYIKNIVDISYFKKHEKFNIFFKFSADILIADLLANLYCLIKNSTCKSNKITHPSLFKKLLVEKMNEFIENKNTVLRSPPLKHTIIENFYNSNYLYIECLQKKFGLLIEETKMNVNKNESKTFSFYLSSEEEISHNKKLENVKNVENDKNWSQPNLNFTLKSKNGKQKKEEIVESHLFPPCDETKSSELSNIYQNQFKTSKKERVIHDKSKIQTKKKIEITIHVEFYVLQNNYTLLENSYKNELDKVFSKEQMSIVTELIQDFKEREIKKITKVLRLNMRNAIQKLDECNNISEKNCYVTNNFLITFRCLR
ncbi:hypothetical protein EDEG_01016 [Edhazardia aedis USNM 41457]|uniref:Uncharacterized protein n=1 Tax=Edhazardia aedis (strain USNM 41457) TaxID=1003232 RepID=J9DBC4_EDHAE|nr:hypothetical protein EDEG_01016 [Edhazardia aedis USNM 41457]|eukprot:EJW04794.1 hypothetical protein EDEG_01016 [Edhazardia aedis USNM 41457]